MDSNEMALNLKIATMLAKIVDELCEANEKLGLLVNLNGKLIETQMGLLHEVRNKNNPTLDFKLEPDAMTLLSLPMSLRKTVIALYKLEKATAEDITKETKRLRAVESSLANQLVRMGYVKKKREGRDVYFYIEASLEAEK
jgi:DNA-binding transcriptional ArsR family regulator